MSKNIDKFCATLECEGILCERDILLAGKSSFRIGGRADVGVFPKNEEQMARVFAVANREEISAFVVGNGSNLLFDDDGYRGCIVFTEGMNNISVCGESIVAECGASLTAIANIARKSSLTGLEFAYGIPGSCGGAVTMNAGAYGGEISDVLISCRVLDSHSGEIYTIMGKDMNFSYRHSAIMEREGLVCLSASFALTAGDGECISEKMRELMERRRSKQPLEYPSAGSVFKRPAPDKYVGQMVEMSGLKGYTVGGACVSEKHAGFIINKGGATAADVRAVIEHVRAVVRENFDVELECEIRTPRAKK